MNPERYSPAIVIAGSPAQALAFLGAFAFGSTLAMGLLTLVVARVGGRIRPSLLGRAQRVLLALAVVFGFTLVVG